MIRPHESAMVAHRQQENAAMLTDIAKGLFSVPGNGIDLLADKLKAGEYCLLVGQRHFRLNDWRNSFNRNATGVRVRDVGRA